MKLSGNNRKTNRMKQSLQTGGYLIKHKTNYTKTCYHMRGKYVNIRFEDLSCFAKILHLNSFNLKLTFNLFYFL